MTTCPRAPEQERYVTQDSLDFFYYTGFRFADNKTKPLEVREVGGFWGPAETLPAIPVVDPALSLRIGEVLPTPCELTFVGSEHGSTHVNNQANNSEQEDTPGEDCEPERSHGVGETLEKPKPNKVVLCS